jgi:hypothetical protein
VAIHRTKARAPARPPTSRRTDRAGARATASRKTRNSSCASRLGADRSVLERSRG